MASQSQWSYRYIEDPINDRRRFHEVYIGSEENWVFQTDTGERPDEAELIVRQWADGRPLEVRLAARGASNYSSDLRNTDSVVRFDQEKTRNVKWTFWAENEAPQGGSLGGPKFPGGDRGFLWQMLQHDRVVVRLLQPEHRYQTSRGTHTLTFPLDGLAGALNEIPGVHQPSAPSPISVGTGIKIGIGVVAVVFLISCASVCL